MATDVKRAAIERHLAEGMREQGIPCSPALLADLVADWLAEDAREGLDIDEVPMGASDGFDVWDDYAAFGYYPSDDARESPAAYRNRVYGHA